MKFTVEIESDNAAMRSSGDVQRALHQIIKRLEDSHIPSKSYYYYGGPIHDKNGNKVGRWSFSNNAEEDEEEEASNLSEYLDPPLRLSEESYADWLKNLNNPNSDDGSTT
jgi:hypothetical protein